MKRSTDAVTDPSPMPTGKRGTFAQKTISKETTSHNAEAHLLAEIRASALRALEAHTDSDDALGTAYNDGDEEEAGEDA